MNQELRELRRKTHEHFLRRDIKWYVSDLLPREIEWIRKANTSDQMLTNATTIIVVVGFSFEPILQILAWYKPKKLKFVIMPAYPSAGGSQTMGRLISRRMRNYSKMVLPKALQEIKELKQNSIDEVSNALFGFHDENESTVVTAVGCDDASKFAVSSFAARKGVPLVFSRVAEYGETTGEPFGYTTSFYERQI